MRRISKATRSFFLTCIWPLWTARNLIVAGLALIFFSFFTLLSTARAETPGSAPAAPPAQGAVTGRAIFEEKCSGCHSIGGGKLVGPDLKDVTKRRDPQWIKSFITDPAKMIASDPTAQQLLKENNNITMPTLGLSPDQVDALVAYLSNPGAAPAATPVPGSTSAGDPNSGSRLFTGELALANGGPPCISCHTVSGTGALGGGGLGPDLTQVVQRLGEPGLSAALKAIPFPTMLGPFQNRPLTAKEQADLLAFFKASNQWQDPVLGVAPGSLTSHALLIFGIGFIGTGVLFGILVLIWVPLRKRYIPRLPVRKL